MDLAIELRNISKEFSLWQNRFLSIKEFLLNPKNYVEFLKSRKIKVLSNINLKVYRGEAISIVGKNGSGKSTLLYIIAKIIKPTKGKVIINGRIFPLLELGTGFHPELTGLENIMLSGLLLGLRKKELISKLESIIEFSELGDFIFQPIKIYSSGMISRLAFSIAINTNPDILLIDEILAVGDISFQKKCRQKIKELKQKGITIVIVSHNEHDIKDLSDRVIVLHKGEIIYDGNVDIGIGIYNQLN